MIGSDNGLSPVKHQAIIANNAGILLIVPMGGNFSRMLIECNTKHAFDNTVCKMTTISSRPPCLKLGHSKMYFYRTPKSQSMDLSAILRRAGQYGKLVTPTVSYIYPCRAGTILGKKKNLDRVRVRVRVRVRKLYFKSVQKQIKTLALIWK